jgi:NADH-quinone oxidoreductase subunit J
MALQITFWILAVIGVGAAISVVVFKDIFRAALSLIMCFLAVAGIFVTLSADFLAIVQILVYVGAVSVLIIIAIMMTKEIKQGSLNNKLIIPALIVAGLFLAVLLFAVLTTTWRTSGVMPPDSTTENLAVQLFDKNGYILPVEIAAMLILASILGAITLVREK